MEGGKPRNVVFKIADIICPLCHRPLSRTSKLSKLPEIHIRKQDLKIIDYEKDNMSK